MLYKRIRKDNTATQRPETVAMVAAYASSKQLLPSGFAEQCAEDYVHIPGNSFDEI